MESPDLARCVGREFEESITVLYMKILILGAGIAGPTLAYWLHEYGFELTLVERAPALREGGYVIDFWGAAFDIAERMELLPVLETAGYRAQELRLVGDAGQRIGGFDAKVFSDLTGGRYLSLARSALSSAIYRRLDRGIERIFGTSVRELREHPEGVDVIFDDGSERRFDLVIGADGLHSRIRQLVFGEEREFEAFLDYEVAAFQVSDYPHRDPDVYVMYTQVGRQIARFSLRDDRTVFLLVWTADGKSPIPADSAAQRELVRARFTGAEWETNEVLAAMDRTDELYFDRVSQIRMPRWSQGRVALVGDAAYCVSLLAGQGSALAMIGATVLAGELYRAKGDYRAAFERYDNRLRPFIEAKQRAAVGFASSFAPKTSWQLFLRNRAMALLNIPFFSNVLLTRELRDRIEVPTYGRSEPQSVRTSSQDTLRH